MKNIITTLPIGRLLGLGELASTAAEAIGRDIGLALNKPALLADDHEAADDAVSAVGKAVAARVAMAKAFEKATLDARTWCFRAKEVLVRHLLIRLLPCTNRKRIHRQLILTVLFYT